MDPLGITFGLLIIAWIALGLLWSVLFGSIAHRNKRLDSPQAPDSPFADWAAQREERVKRAEWRHATRYGDKP